MAEAQDKYLHSSHSDGELKKVCVTFLVLRDSGLLCFIPILVRIQAPTTPTPSAMAKRLYAFDFDHTIIEENSDYEVKKLLKGLLPPEIESRCTGTTFTAYMDLVMKYIGSQGTTIHQVGDFMKTMEFVPGKPLKSFWHCYCYKLYK